MKTLLFAILCGLLVLAGCATVGKPNVTQQVIETPKTEIESVIKIVQKTDWMVTLAVLIAGVGFFSFLSGHSVGLKLMATSFVVIGIILMMARFTIIIAIISLAAASLLLIYTIFQKTTALKEVVAGVERVKLKLSNMKPDYDDEDIKEIINDELAKEQSSVTEDVVKSIKNNLEK